MAPPSLGAVTCPRDVRNALPGLLFLGVQGTRTCKPQGGRGLGEARHHGHLLCSLTKVQLCSFGEAPLWGFLGRGAIILPQTPRTPLLCILSFSRLVPISLGPIEPDTVVTGGGLQAEGS